MHKLTFWCVRTGTVTIQNQQCALCLLQLYSTVNDIEIRNAQQLFYGEVMSLTKKKKY
jgi:hypothetical protein